MTRAAGVLLLACLAGAVHSWSLPEPWAWTASAGLSAAALMAGLAWRMARWLPLMMLATVLVFTRGLQHQQVSLKLNPVVGHTVALTGTTDGRFVSLTAPRGVRVLTHDGLEPGRVTLQGRLRPARSARNPGGFDERRWLHALGVEHVLEDVTVVAHHPAARVRWEAAVQALTGGRTDPGAQILTAMVLGVRRVDGDLRERFSRSGLAHLLALSGLHVGLLAGALALLLTPLGRLRWLAVIAVVVAYGSVVGFTPSLQRATAMLTVGAVWLAAGRKRPPLLALALLAAALALAYRPSVATGLSFQLSYAAVGAILLLGGPPIRRLEASRLPRVVRWPLASLTVSAAATAGTASLVAGAFQQVPLAGPLVNLAAMPAATLLVPAGFVTALAGAVLEPLVGGLPPWVSAPVHTIATLLDRLALEGARLPVVVWGEITWGGHVLWFTALGALAAALHGRMPPAAAGTVACLAAAASWSAAPLLDRPEATVLDVGQGNAVVLRLPGGHAWLVDAGGTPFGDYDVGAEVVVPALRALGVFKLDVAVATHADADHIEGFETVLTAVPTGVLHFGHGGDRPLWQDVQAVARERGVAVEPVRRGDAWQVGETTLRVLHPTPETTGNANADSVVLQVDWRGRPWLLLTGDIDHGVEALLPAVPTPVVLASHHGARNGTGATLLAKTGPKQVIVSAGAGNRYGHPHDQTLGRLTGRGITVMRTDQDGAVRLKPAW